MAVGRQGLRGWCAGVLTLALFTGWTCTAVAAAPQDVFVTLSSAYNTDAVATFGSATKGGTSLDTQGDVIEANSWPTASTLTTTKFTSSSGAATTGAAVTFRLPAASNTADNAIINSGQPVALPAGHYSEIYFLGAATWGPVSTDLQLQYHNGTNSQVAITWPDWWGPGDAATAVITGKAGGPSIPASGQPVGLYAFAYPVNPAHTLDAVQLPGTLPPHNGGPAAIHIFAISLLPAPTQAATGTGATSASSAPSALPKTGMPLTVPLMGACLTVVGVILGFRRRLNPAGGRS